MKNNGEHTLEHAPSALQYFINENNSFSKKREKQTIIHANPHECSNVVLVVHASVGSGHKLAAQAIAQAFEALQTSAALSDTAPASDIATTLAATHNPDTTPASTITPASDTALALNTHNTSATTNNTPYNVNTSDIHVELIDILDFGRIRFNGDRWAHLFTGVTRPWYDFIWRYLFTGRMLWGGGWSWSRVMFPRFTKFIREKKPLAVVCTHITAANCAVGARMVTGQNFPVVCVPTDYETEGWWPHRAADLFCVGTESMAETLRPRKVEEERIAITGIPTRLDFSQECNRASIRELHGLPHDKTVVLALAGSTMASPYVLFRNILDQIIPYMHSMPNVHLLFCAGNDEEYRRHLQRSIEDMRLDNVSVIGFTEEIAALMSCCDAVLCKPGGLVTTEALCTKTPLILVGRAYGQELINVRMLTSRGAALHVTTGRELVEVLRLFSLQPKQAQSLLVNANTLRRPHAAQDIVQKTMDLALGKTPMIAATRKHYFGHLYWGKKPAHTR